VKAGVDPEKFWKLTLRQVLLLIQRSRFIDNSDWERTRNIEFSNYQTAFAGMSGENPFKKIKRPRDLYRLDNDISAVIPVDNKVASVDVERMKQHFKWQDKQKDSTKTN